MRIAALLLLLAGCGGPEPVACELVLATVRDVPIACYCPASCGRPCSASMCERFDANAPP